MIKLKYAIYVKILIIIIMKMIKSFLKQVRIQMALKNPRSLIEPINTFQSAGAATWSDLSPKVTLLLQVGVASNKTSKDDLKL